MNTKSVTIGLISLSLLGVCGLTFGDEPSKQKAVVDVAPPLPQPAGSVRLRLVDQRSNEYVFDVTANPSVGMEPGQTPVTLKGHAVWSSGATATVEITLMARQFVELASRYQTVRAGDQEVHVLPGHPDVVLASNTTDAKGRRIISMRLGDSTEIGSVEIFGKPIELERLLDAAGMTPFVEERLLLATRALFLNVPFQSGTGERGGMPATMEECHDLAVETCTQNCGLMEIENRNCIATFSFTSSEGGTQCGFSCYTKAQCCANP